MLAAVPSESDRRLELFRLALMLVYRGTATLPAPLEQYFDALLSQARSLAGDPSEVSASHLPQAMQLANELRCNSELTNALAHVESAEDLNPEIAHRALRTLEPILASAD